MEALFMLIEINSLIQQLDILNYSFLYPTYADDTTIFLHNIDCVKKLMRTFQEFAYFFGLSHNMSKCEIATIRRLKGVKIAVRGKKNIYLIKKSVKKTRISFSCNAAIQNELCLEQSHLKYKQF